MTGTLGHYATLLAFALSVVGAAVGIVAGLARRPHLAAVTRALVGTVFVLGSLAVLLMVLALVAHDFSVSYVAQVGSRATPVFYTIVSLWSSLDGSLLFWGWVLAAYTLAVSVVYRRAHPRLTPLVLGTMLAVGAFFWALVTWPANPFAPVFPVPPDGPGPNPLLQNHPFMALHPPLLYLGYIGMTVPFAFAIAALASGELGERWLRASRPWTLSAWAFLTWGIVGGGWWSYEVLGWGGYWAWDPVENASLMPWLTATAFLHSTMVQERRQMMRTWNLALIVATFALTLLGTFLTRSGILGSVHAFSEGLIGPLFLLFISTVLLVTLALIGWRSDRLKTPGTLDAILSRESAFLLNNLLLTVLTFTVLVGTLFPLAVEVARGVQVSVGAPYFNQMGVPVLLALIFLLGVGPALTWRRTSAAVFRRKLLYAAAATVVGAIAGWAAGARSLYTILAFALAGFALALNLGELWIPVRARRRVHRDGPFRSLFAVTRSNPRRYGGYVVHTGLIVMAIGIAASGSFQSKTEATLGIGETVHLGGYELRLDSLYAGREPHRDFVAAGLSVVESGSPAGELRPRLNYYATSDRPIVTPAVRSSLKEDLYVTLRAYERDGSTATLEAMVTPLIVWIWIGAAIMAAGALLAMRPPRRKSRNEVQHHEDIGTHHGPVERCPSLEEAAL
ncbi:MAG: heme lyase CcmF/NrfE family subunit [Gemmatimonadetes bacterium]|nr:heme lyase CcmF/NrfE family subunit [Gemmatimonadota bacterium]